MAAWSDIDIKRLRHLNAVNCSMEDIAISFGRSVEACRLAMRRNGIERAPAVNPDAWSDEEIATLRRLWSQGATNEAIREAIPLRTQSSINTRASMLKLPRRGIRAEKPQPHEPKPMRRPVCEEPAGRKAVRYIAMKFDQCKWFVGPFDDIEPGERLTCGEKARTGSSYCARHHAIVWTMPAKPPSDRSRSNSPNPRRRPALIAEGV